MHLIDTFGLEVKEPFAPPWLSKVTEQHPAIAEMIAKWVGTFSEEWNVSLLCFSSVTIERSQPAIRHRLVGTTGAAMFVELTDAAPQGYLIWTTDGNERRDAMRQPAHCR